ncbi:ileal sodium/bile acid cotransporter-like [Glandiceps talaboti]
MELGTVVTTGEVTAEAVVYAANDCPKDIAVTLVAQLLNGTNATAAPPVIPSYVPAIQIVKATTTIVVTLGMMISMGCVITFQETFAHVKKPFAILIGFLCQYGILPLTGFGLSHLFKLEPQYALGVLIMSCCPGGTTSNILTYWIHGDVSLSICMTTCSTIVAFGMMPLLLYIYSRSWTDNPAVIPYTQIVITLVCILVPVVVGMFIRHKSKPIADKVSRVLATVALVGIGMIVIFEAILRSDTYTKHTDLWIIGFMLPGVGGGVSFAIATFVKLPGPQKRTVAVETGWQNLGVALTLILMSFPNDAGEVGAFVSIYLAIQSSLVYALVPIGCFCSKRLEGADKKEQSIEYRNGNAIEIQEENEGEVKINLSDRNGYKALPKDNESTTAVTITSDGPAENELNSAQKEAMLTESVI